MKPPAGEAAPESDRFDEAPHPRLTQALVGHAEAERTLLDGYRTGRLAHAWLIGGREGIGKATLAWRFARFVLAHPDPATPAVQDAASLSVAPDHPVARRLAAGSMSDVFVLRREWNDKVKPAKFFTEIRIDDVRRAIGLFQRAASAGGWRICIVDCAEDLNASSANALLKLIEEPPPRCLFLIVSHKPAQVLATIRSRCRRLLLQPLGADAIAAAMRALGPPWSQQGVDAIAAAAASAGECFSGDVVPRPTPHPESAKRIRAKKKTFKQWDISAPRVHPCTK